MDYIDSKLVSKMPFQKRSFAGVLKRRAASHKQLRKIPYGVCVLKGNLHTHEVDRGLSTHTEVPHVSSLPSHSVIFIFLYSYFYNFAMLHYHTSLAKYLTCLDYFFCIYCIIILN